MVSFRDVIKFAIPIAAGNILQQLYQIVSSIVVGRCCGDNSLAALGVSTPIVSLALFFMIGIGLGLTVLLGKYYGIGDTEKYREIAYTAKKGGLVFAAAFAAVAVLATYPVLALLETPPEIKKEAAIYLWIVFAGLPLTFLYNYNSSAYLSIKKPKIPFYALAVSSATNILLCLILVAVCHFGIIGAAIANVAATGSSVVFCEIYTAKNTPLLQLHASRSDENLHFEKRYIGEIIGYSGAAAIQQIIFIIGRLIIQRWVNMLGVSLIAGYTAAANLESLVIAPCDGIAAAIASMVAVSYGKEAWSEIRETAFAGFKVCLAYASFVAVLLWTLSPFLVPLFLEEPGEIMVETGVTYLRWMFFGYVWIAFPEAFLGFFRGLGEIRTTIFGTLTQIIVRVAFTYCFLFSIGIKAISIGTFAGWVAMVVVYYAFLRSYRKNHPEL